MFDTRMLRIGSALLGLALIAGCVQFDFTFDFVFDFDKPLAPLEEAIDVPGLAGEWISKSDGDRVTIEAVRSEDLPGPLYAITLWSPEDTIAAHGWVIKAGDSLYLNLCEPEPQDLESAEAFAAWEAKGDPGTLVMRIELGEDTLDTYAMREGAPAVPRLFAEGVLEKSGHGVVINRLHEALAVIPGADVFPASDAFLELTRSPSRKVSP